MPRRSSATATPTSATPELAEQPLEELPLEELLGRALRGDISTAEISRRYRNGETTESLAVRFRCHLQTIYNRLAKAGGVLEPKERVERRFWKKVQKTDSCWLWTGWRAKNGYGFLNRLGQRTLAHRLAYELLVGPIPTGLTIDHLCRVRQCVNPDRLEPVTLAENVLRGVGRSAVNARLTECLRGHAFNDENTRITTSGSRECRTCRRERKRNGSRAA